MIHLMRDPGRVQVRAMCAVFRNGSEILVSLGKDTDNDQLFGRVIGGGVEFGKIAEQALQREFMVQQMVVASICCSYPTLTTTIS